jgi:transposase-like protein
MTRRVYKVVDGQKRYLCQGVSQGFYIHKPRWLAINEFPTYTARGIKYRRHTCKFCLNSVRQARRTGNLEAKHGYVPTADVRKWLIVLIDRCMGVKAAARELGVAHQSIYRWLNGQPHLQREKAALIFYTVQRVMQYGPVHVTTKGRRKSKRVDGYKRQRANFDRRTGAS